MEIQVKLSELRKKKIFVATPMYGGQCHGAYTNSAINLANLGKEYGVDIQFYFMFNESLITRGRNYCADEFMRSDCTHLMFIDSDIKFQAQDVLTLAALSDHEDKKDGKHIICGPYPKKTIAWEKIVKAVEQGKGKDNPGELENYVGDYVFNLKDGKTSFKIAEPTELKEAGTGFMMITKHAFEVFKNSYPDYSYIPDHARTKNFDGSREIHMFFQALIDPDSRRYLSEDYMFCQWMDKVGISTWMCPWMQLKHNGSYEFGGSVGHLASINASVGVNDKEIKNMKK